MSMVRSTEWRYLFTVGGQSGECPIRFECVEVFSPDWLIVVLAQVNRWRPVTLSADSEGCGRGPGNSFAVERVVQMFAGRYPTQLSEMS